MIVNAPLLMGVPDYAHFAKMMTLGLFINLGRHDASDYAATQYNYRDASDVLQVYTDKD